VIITTWRLQVNVDLLWYRCYLRHIEDKRAYSNVADQYCSKINGTIPPADSTCWNWNPIDLTFQKGCDNEQCEKAVCECDRYCCDTSWDLSCRGYNINNTFPKDNPQQPGCSASILCCEEELEEEEDLLNNNNQGFCNNLNAVVPPMDSSCWNYNYVGNPKPYQKGCDYEACQSAVCACDPYCCSTSWDEACRGHSEDGTLPKDNFMIPGCSASILCCEDAWYNVLQSQQEENQTLPENDDAFFYFNLTAESYEANIPRYQGYCDNLMALAPPSDSNCWEVGLYSNRKGCDYEACQNAVCSCDPYCCTTVWDESCRGSIYDNISECSASVLCCEHLEQKFPSSSVTACPSDPSVSGYTDIQTLNYDMTLQISDVYVLCPSTTFDLKNGVDNSITPKTNTILICGNGYNSNQCLIQNGLHHLIFHPNETITNVIIQGITFSKSASTSIVGWSSFPSNVLFRDCVWKHNHGFSVIDLYGGNDIQRRLHFINSHFLGRFLFHPERQKGMDIDLENCAFTENIAKIGIFLAVKGKAKLTNCMFLLNAVGGIALGAADDAVFQIDERTSFSNNTSGFSTFFVDSTSTLELKETQRISRLGNHAGNCSGFFLEEKGSECLSMGGYQFSCFGNCI